MVSRRHQIRSIVLNQTLGKFVRAVDAVLDAYIDQGSDLDDESEYVVKLALMLLLTNFFDEEDVVLLVDSSQLRIPKSLSQTSQFDIRRLLSGKPDPHAPPDEDEYSSSLGLDPETGEIYIDDSDK